MPVEEHRQTNNKTAAKKVWRRIYSGQQGDLTGRVARKRMSPPALHLAASSCSITARAPPPCRHCRYSTVYICTKPAFHLSRMHYEVKRCATLAALGPSAAPYCRCSWQVPRHLQREFMVAVGRLPCALKRASWRFGGNRAFQYRRPNPPKPWLPAGMCSTRDDASWPPSGTVRCDSERTQGRGRARQWSV